MANGRIYVPVEANTADGITTMSTSGGTISGSWLTWTEYGFQNVAWQTVWDDPNLPIKSWWNTNHMGSNVDVKYEYTNDVNGFIKWLNDESVASLDKALSSWNGTDAKTEFMNTYDFRGCYSN